METIHVFIRLNALDYRLAVNVCRQRQLHQNTVHIRGGIEFVNQLQQLFFGSGRCQFVGTGVETSLFTGNFFVVHIHNTGRITANQQNSQTRGAQALFAPLGHFVGKFQQTFVSNGFTIEKLGCHRLFLFCRVGWGSKMDGLNGCLG